MIVITLVVLYGPGQKLHAAPAQEKQIHIRVCRDGAPVAGLQAADFQLTQGTQTLPVTAVEPVVSRLQQPEPLKPRSIALVLNVSRSQVDLLAPLQSFIRDTLKPNDRLLVVTNHFVVPEHLLVDPDAEIGRIGRLIETEQKWQELRMNVMKMEMERFSMRMRRGLSTLYATDEYTSPISGESVELFQVEFPRFMEAYKQFILEYRQQYIQIQPQNLVQLNQFLERQGGGAWVVSLFQHTALPQIKESSQFVSIVHGALAGGSLSSADDTMSNFTIWDRMQDLQKKLGDMELEVQKRTDLALSPNRALFHTLRLTGSYGTSSAGGEFEWRPVSLSAENALVESTRASGGILTDMQKVDAFLQQVASREEVGYRITCQPVPGSIDPISIRVSGSDQVTRFTPNPAKDDRNETISISVNQVKVEKQILTFSIAVTTPDRQPVSGTIPVTIQLTIVDQNLKPVLSTQKEFPITADAKPIEIQLPKLKRGKYDLVLTATSAQYNCGDLIIESLEI